jgi:hypothetical protein
MTKKSLVALLGLSVIATPLAAQVTVNASASITVPAVLSLNVTNTSVGFAAPTAADYTAGFAAQNTAASVVSHAGNVRHDVRIWTDQATFTGSGGGAAPDAVNAAKPAGDLLWSTDNFGVVTHPLTQSATAAAASGANQVLVSQAARGVYNNSNTVTFRINLSYANDTPGTYSINFFYTAIAN